MDRAPHPSEARLRTAPLTAVQIERLIFRMVLHHERSGIERGTPWLNPMVHPDWLAPATGEPAESIGGKQRVTLSDHEHDEVASLRQIGGADLFRWRNLSAMAREPWELLRAALAGGRIVLVFQETGEAVSAETWDFASAPPLGFDYRSPPPLALPLLDAAMLGHTEALSLLGGKKLGEAYRIAVLSDLDVQAAVYGAAAFIGDRQELPYVHEQAAAADAKHLRSAGAIYAPGFNFVAWRTGPAPGADGFEALMFDECRHWLRDMRPPHKLTGAWLDGVRDEKVPASNVALTGNPIKSDASHWTKVLAAKHEGFFQLFAEGLLTATGYPGLGPPLERVAIPPDAWGEKDAVVDIATGRVLGPQGEVWFRGVTVEAPPPASPATSVAYLEEIEDPKVAELKKRLSLIGPKEKRKTREAEIFLDVFAGPTLPEYMPNKNTRCNSKNLMDEYHYLFGSGKKDPKTKKYEKEGILHFSEPTLREVMRRRRQSRG